MSRRALFATVMASLAAGAVPAQTQQAAPPPWVRRYFAAEHRGQRFARTWLNRTAAIAAARQGARPHGAPPPGVHDLRGTFRMAVIAATWSDVTPVIQAADIQNLFFAPNATGSRHTLAEYYTAVSGGRFTIAGTVTPWLSLAQPKSFYSNGTAQIPFVRDAVIRADSTVDWRLYDNDGADGLPNSGDDDGFVDLVTVMHPLSDGVCRAGGPVGTGWRLSISGAFGGQPYTTHSTGANGQKLKIEDFVLAAATHCSGTGIASVNISTHEMGHALGLPDLYDLDQSSFGVGLWDVMGYGIYLLDGAPALMSAWTKSRLGWIDVLPVTANTTLSIPASETSRISYRINLPGANEYLLLENRQAIGFDANLPGTGLLVWHIDDDVLQVSVPQYRANENDARPGVGLLQADGRRDLALRANQGDGGDPFPGSTANPLVTDATTPSTRNNTGGASNIQLQFISVSGGVVSVTVQQGDGIALATPMLQISAAGGTAPPAASQVQVISTGLPQSGLTATALYAPGESPWLTATLGATTTPAVLNVGLTTTHLAPGPHSARVAVTPGPGGGFPDTLDVQLIVTEPSLTRIHAEVLRGNTLSAGERTFLDTFGNNDAGFDIGDVLAWLDRHGGLPAHAGFARTLLAGRGGRR